MHFNQLLDSILRFLRTCGFSRYLDATNPILLVGPTCSKRLLWNEDLGARLRRNVLYRLALLPDNKAYIAICDLHDAHWISERASFTNVNAHL